MSSEHGNVPWIEPRTFETVKELASRYVCAPEMKYDACEIFAGSYDLPGLRFSVPPKILDIGANCGAFAVWSSWRWPGARVECYEPNPAALMVLAQNVVKLGGVTIHPVGVLAEAEAGKPLRTGKHNLGEASFHDLGAQLAETTPVEVVSARTLPDCDILKVDTEGCEVEIIRTFMTERKGVLPQVVMFEFHRERDRRTLDDFLIKSNYVLARGMVQYPDIGVLCYAARSIPVEDAGV